MSPVSFGVETASSWHCWQWSKCGVPWQRLFSLLTQLRRRPPSHISSAGSSSPKRHRLWDSMAVKGDVGGPMALRQFPVGCLPATLQGLLPGVPSVKLCRGRLPGPSKHLSGSQGLRLAPGTPAVPGGQLSWGRAHGPRSCSGSNLPLPLCVIHSPRRRMRRSASRKAKGATCR